MTIFHDRFNRYGLLLLAASCTVFAPARGAEEAPTPPKPPARMVGIEAHFLRATDAQIAKALKSTTDGGALRGVIPAEELAAVTQALREAKADFFSSPRLVTKSGQRALVEAVRELRYPTEFSPAGKKDGPMIPTAFETRNVGVTVEIEPVTGPDQAIDLTVTPSIVTFLGFIEYSGKPPAAENGGPDKLERSLSAPLRSGGIWQPVFASSKINTSVTLQSGQSVLLGGMAEDNPALPKSSTGSPNRLTYILLTARAVGNSAP